MALVDSSDFSENISSRGKKYALVVGVRMSSRMPALPVLKYAESDAQGIDWLLGRKESNFAFSSPALTGEKASTQNVRQAILHLIAERKPEDLLLFYFIGHCYLNKKNTDIYLVTADFDPDISEKAPGAHLSLGWLYQMLFEENRKTNVLLLLDCYYAEKFGEVPVELFMTTQKYLSKSEHPGRTLAIISSIQPDIPHAENNGSSARMTGMILDALGGKDKAALDSEGNVTLLSLYGYLQKRMESAGLQKPDLSGNQRQRLILAGHPDQNPVRKNLQDFVPEAESAQRAPIYSAGEFFDTTFCLAATLDDLDMEQVKAFLQKERVLLQDDYRADLNIQGQLTELGLLDVAGHPSYGALLCFGRRPSRRVAGAYIHCIDWRGNSRLSEREEKEYRGSLLEQFTLGCTFLQKHLQFGRVIDSEGSSERPELPFRVLEESLVNALVHREYATESGHRFRAEGGQVEIFSDRIEISSPGSLPASLSLDALTRASKEYLGSHPRNPQIMRIFYLAGYVEKVGSGVERMQRLMEDAGLRQPEFLLSRQQMLTVLLFRPVQTEGQQEPRPDHLKPARNRDLPNVTVLPSLISTTHIPEPAYSEEPSPWRNDSQALSPRLPGDLPDVLTKKSEAELPDDDVPAARRRFPDDDFRGKLISASPRLSKRKGLIAVLLSVLLVLSAGLGVSWRSGLLNSVFPAPASSPVGTAHIILPPTSTTIEIASDFPTSGLDTLSGLPLQNGVQMAITQANHENLLPGGYTLKLVPYDDVGIGNRHDPQVGARNLQQAIANPLIAGVVGPYNSSVALAELPVANRAPIALLSPGATNPCLTKSGADDPSCATVSPGLQTLRPTSQLTFFRLVTTDDVQGKATAEYFFNVAHYRKVLLLKDDSDFYSSGLSQAFTLEWQTLGGQVIPLDLPQVSSSEQDYQVALRSVVSTQPDLIYFVGDNPNGTYALQALASIPELKSVAFAGSDGIVDNDLPQAAARLHLNAPVYGSLPVVDPNHADTPAGADFEANYTANGFTNFRSYAASAYDCTMMLIEAIKLALQQGAKTPRGEQDQAGGKHFREAVLQALAHLSYTGATGKHSFDANGDTTNHTISVYRLNAAAVQPTWAWLQRLGE